MRLVREVRMIAVCHLSFASRTGSRSAFTPGAFMSQPLPAVTVSCFLFVCVSVNIALRLGSTCFQRSGFETIRFQSLFGCQWPWTYHRLQGRCWWLLQASDWAMVRYLLLWEQASLVWGLVSSSFTWFSSQCTPSPISAKRTVVTVTQVYHHYDCHATPIALRFSQAGDISGLPIR